MALLDLNAFALPLPGTKDYPEKKDPTTGGSELQAFAAPRPRPRPEGGDDPAYYGELVRDADGPDGGDDMAQFGELVSRGGNDRTLGDFIEHMVPTQVGEEFAKATVAGAAELGATTLAGASALDPREGYARDIQKYSNKMRGLETQADLDAFISEIEASDEHPITKMIVRRTAQDIFSGETPIEELDVKPIPLADRELYRAAQEIRKKVGEEVKPAAGWEDSVTVMLGKGVGTVVAGVAASALGGPVVSGAAFTAAGVGEAAEKAIAFDREDRAKGGDGLTEQQILLASFYGIAPGSTDIIPVEFLLGRLGIRQPFRSALGKFIGRMGGQVFIEGIQEGGQEWLQNLIEREVYNPDKESLMEGVPGSAGLGGGVGAITQLGKEFLQLLVPGRERGSSNVPPPTEEGDADLPEGAVDANTLYPEPEEEQDLNQPLTEERAKALLGELAAIGGEGARLQEQPYEQSNLPRINLPEAGPQWPITEEGAAPQVEENLPEPDLVLPETEVTAEADEDLADFGEPASTAAIRDRVTGVVTELAGQEDAVDQAMTALGWDENTQQTVRDTIAEGGASFAELDEQALTTVEEYFNDLVTELSRDTSEGDLDAALKGLDEIFGGDTDTQTAEAGTDTAGPRRPGGRENVVTVENGDDLEQAQSGEKGEGSAGQNEAENAEGDHIKLHGHKLTIETRKGETRKSTTLDERGNPEWEVEMPVAYARIMGTTGNDGDHLDAFIGDSPESKRVWVINQDDAESGEFDEHKIMYGFNTEDEATDAYVQSFSDGLGPDRMGSVVETTLEELDQWMKDGDKSVPYARGDRSGAEEETAQTEEGTEEAGATETETEAETSTGDGSTDQEISDAFDEALDELFGPEDAGTGAEAQSDVTGGPSAGGKAQSEAEEATSDLADPFEGVGEQSQVRVTVREAFEQEDGKTYGPVIEGKFWGRIGGVPYLSVDDGSTLGTTIEIDPANVENIEVLKSREEIDQERYDTARGEPWDGMELEQTRDGYEKYLTALAGAIGLRGETSERGRQLRQQFDDVADQVRLAKKKRNWLLAKARYKGQEEFPTKIDLAGGDAGRALQLEKPKPEDFDPDIEGRQRSQDAQVEARDMISKLRKAGFKANFSLGNPDGDPNNAILMVTMPGGKQNGRFEVTGQTNNAGDFVWKERSYEPNDSNAAQDRIRKARRSDDFRKMQAILAGQEENPLAVRIRELRDQIMLIASGMSRTKDLAAGSYAIGSNEARGIGVDVGELSKPGIQQLAKAAVDLQTPIFIDSGAFSMFRRNLRRAKKAETEGLSDDFETIDFDKVLERYEAIEEAIEEYNSAEEPFRILMVMPDIVGDQKGSLDLVAQYADFIKIRASSRFTRPIVPIQKGDLSLAEAYAKVAEILGTEDFIVGIPSNEKAVSLEDLKTFLAEAKPRQIHFLGSASPKTLAPKLAILADSGLVFDHLSADANRLRSALYGRYEGERQEGIVEILGEQGEQALEEVFDESIDKALGPTEEAIDLVETELEGTPAAGYEELVEVGAMNVDEGKPVKDAAEEATLELDTDNDDVRGAVEEVIDVIPDGDTDEIQQQDTSGDSEQSGQTTEGVTGGPRQPGADVAGGKPASGDGNTGQKGGTGGRQELTDEQKKARAEEIAKKANDAKKRREEERQAELEKFQDVGEKIGGARKDLWRQRGLELGDLDDMDAAERKAYTTKENVWKRPDYSAIVSEQGRTPEFAFYVKTIYDRIGGKPSREGSHNQEIYIEVVRLVRSMVEESKTVDDIKSIGNALYDLLSKPVTDEDSFRVQGETVQYWDAMDIIGRRTGRHAIMAFRPDIFKKDERLARRAIEDENFPNSEPWRRLYDVDVRREYKRDEDGLIVRNENGAVEEEPTFWVYRKGKVRSQVSGPHATREIAEANAQTAYENELAGRNADGELVPTRPHLKNIKRVGPDYRAGRNIESAQDFIDTFGFRAAEFGNWVGKLSERQEVVNLAYDAFMDLARALNVPPKALSLDGTLAIAFGSRGRGGKNAAAAHYEDLYKVINLTRLKGAGTLAHEWAHALDDYLGWISGGEEAANFKLGGGESMRLGVAFRALMKSLYYRLETNEEMAARYDAAIAEAEASVNSWTRHITSYLQPAIAKAQARGDRTRGLETKERKARDNVRYWKRQVEIRKERKANAKERDRKATTDTSFADNARLLDKSRSKPYWTQGTEMLARSFEAYVFDKLASEGNVSQYLVHSVEADRFGPEYKGNPYPTGDERIDINLRYDGVLEELEVIEGKNGADTRIAGKLGKIEDEVDEVDPDTRVDLETPVPVDQQEDTNLDHQDEKRGEPTPTLDPLVIAFRDFFANPVNSFRTITDARKFAGQRGFTAEAGTPEAKTLDEKIEAGVVLAAKKIVEESETPERAYYQLVELYRRMPNLSTRTSGSVSMQAYSTPVPLAYLAQKLAGIAPRKSVFEPTAGNGALLFTADEDFVWANELDESRANTLKAMGFRTVMTLDAATDPDVVDTVVGGGHADVVIANPPFGSVQGKRFVVKSLIESINGWNTTQIDHAIALQSLQAMKDADGRAVLIVGSVKEATDKVRTEEYASKSKREFYWRLYNEYNVVDHFTVSGNLYQRQGAGWPVDVIVIEGRGKSARPYPTADLPRVFTGWEELWDAYSESVYAEVRAGTDETDASGTGLEGGSPTGEGTSGGGQPVAVPGPGGGDTGGILDAGDQRQPADLEGQPTGGTTGDGLEPSGGGISGGSSGQPNLVSTDQEISDAFDEALDELFPDEQSETTEVAPPPQETKPKTAKEAFTKAGQEAGMSLDDALKGLDALFNDPNKLGVGFVFDEETWQKAKPFLETAWNHVKAGAKNAAEGIKLLAKEMVQKFNWGREQIARAKPYFERFVKEQFGKKTLSYEAEDVEIAYVPQSKGPSLGTLMPGNMARHMRTALERIETQYGQIDEWIANELNFADTKELWDVLAAEQVDAVAMALDNVKKGEAFIIGDQTGIGKGRVVASMLRYSLLNGITPVFVTEKANLFGDMIRDLNDVKVPEMLGREPRFLITNNGVEIPIDKAALDWVISKDLAIAEGEPTPTKQGKFLKAPGKNVNERYLTSLQEEMGAGPDKSFDMVFTTYSQMQTVSQVVPLRRTVLNAIAPTAFVVMDESHNAGGSPGSRQSVDKIENLRSEFFRDMASRAQSVMFSSATYAKNPGVMDLYGRTDMGKAVDDLSLLGELISRGKVPMQQAVAQMLAEAGQYLRRERSFKGVDYELTPVDVDVDAYGDFSKAISAIAQFDIALKQSDFWSSIKTELMHDLEAMGFDPSTGEAGVSSMTFSSVMHNVVNQMLLSIKANSAADAAIAALENGEKPVITLASTMGSFIAEYVEENRIGRGGSLDGLTFRRVIERYLKRTLRFTVKKPNDVREYVFVDPSRLSGNLAEMYAYAEDAVANLNVDNLPMSPIDWIHFRLKEAGYNVGEITGRTHIMQYSQDEDGIIKQTYLTRSDAEKSAAGRTAAIARFNERDGEADENHVLILNQSGSTGLSLHASEKFLNKKRRRMILAQAEANIDTHMQMLGRVHRTGQVIPPAYSQLYGDIPAESRPAAVLAKKMASLNANTTASRDSKFSAGEEVDFLNEYGDAVVGDLLRSDPSLQFATQILPQGKELTFPEDVASKFLGKLTLLPPQRQQEVIDEIQETYKLVIDAADAAGENMLKQTFMDLQAELVEQTQLKPQTGPSPFERAVTLDRVNVKAVGRALPFNEILNRIGDSLRVGASERGDLEITDANLRMVEERSKKAASEFWEKTRDENEATVRKDMEAIKAAETRIERRLNEVRAEAETWRKLYAMVYPGAVFSMDVEGQWVPVISMETKLRKGSKNPFALGSWTVEFAVPNNKQRMIAPFSALHIGRTEEDIGRKVVIGQSRQGLKDVHPIFEAATKEGTEERFIISGNPLAGYELANGRGMIVNYSDNQGNIKPGILTPKTFDAKKFSEERPIRFKTIEQFKLFYSQAEGTTIEDRTGTIKITNTGFGQGFITLPSKKTTGGRWYTLESVRQASGDNFVKRGREMVFRGPHQNIWAVAEAFMEAGALLETRTNQELAEKIVGETSLASTALRLTAPEVRLDPRQQRNLENNIRARIRNVFGKDIPISLEPIIPAAGVGSQAYDEAMQRYRDAGGTIGDTAGGVFSVMSSGEAIIRIATDDPNFNPMDNAYHEAYHAIEALLMTPLEYAAANEQVNVDQARQMAQEFLGADPDAMSTMPGYEARAIAFEAFMQARETSQALDGMSAPLRRFFTKLRNLIRGMKRLLTNRSLTLDEIFEMAAEGRFANRQRQPAPRRLDEIEADQSAILSQAQRNQLNNPFAANGAQARQRLLLGGVSAQPLDRLFRAPFEIFGALDERGEWRAGRYLHDGAARIIRESKFDEESRFSFLNPMFHVARMNLVDRYGLDDDYIKRERERSLEERGRLKPIPELMKLMRSSGIVGGAEAKVLQDVLTGEMVGPTQWQSIAEPIRNAIMQMGAEAVDYGLLSRESYERNLGSYLHRVYHKHESDQGHFSRWVDQIMKNRRRRIIGDQLKGRGIFKKVSKDKIPTDIGERLKKGNMYVLWDKMAADDKTVLKREWRKPGSRPSGLGWESRGQWEYRGDAAGKAVLWRDYTRDEREKMGEIFDARYTVTKTFMLLAHDLSVGRFYKDISENPEWATDQEPAEGNWKNAGSYDRFWGDPNIEWVRVPATKLEKSKTPKYGMLAGKYVRAEIWRDINELEVMQKATLWRSVMTQWKLNKTARSPVVHMNNVMSNMLLMDMSGVGTVDLVAGLRSLITKDDLYHEAEAGGALGADIITQEIRQTVLEPLLREIENQNAGTLEARIGILGRVADRIFSKGALVGAMYGAAAGNFAAGPLGAVAGAGVGAVTGAIASKPIDRLDLGMLRAYQVEDEVFRLALYHRRRAQGVDSEQAADEAREQFIDYDIRAPLINKMRRTGWPFLAYTYRAIPLVAKTVATRPWKIAKYLAVTYALQALAFALVPGDDDEERRSMREEDQADTWLLTPQMMRLPWQDEHGNPYYLNVRRWIPAADVFDLNQGSPAIDMVSWLMPGGPLMLGAELALNKQAFTGDEITNDLTDDIWDKGAKLGDWAWKSWMPSAAYLPGSWYWEKVGQAMGGGVDRAGDPLSVGDALISSVGIKVRPVDVKENFKIWGYRFKQIENELKNEYRRAYRQFRQNLISKEAFDAQQARVRAKREALKARRIYTLTGEEE